MSNMEGQGVRAMLDQAEAREEEGDLAGAESLLDSVVAAAPELGLGWYRRGMLRLFELEDYGGALQDFTRAGKVGVEEHGIPLGQLHMVMGESLFGLDRYEEAATHLREAARSEEDPVLQAELYYRLAECADELGDQDELYSAIRAFLDRSDAFLESGGDESQVTWAREQLAESSQ